MIPGKHFWTAVVAALCVAFVTFRFVGLTASCLWFDEIFSVHAASQPWSGILGFVALDLIHPPLFYVLLKIWTVIGGESVGWVRFFPFTFAVAALWPLLYLLRDLRAGRAATILAILFIAVNGSLIKYAQEVRMYSVVMLLSLLSIWLFVRFFYLGKNIWLLTMVNAFLIYTHYFGWLLIIAEVVTIIVLQRIKIRQILIMVGIEIAAFAPWLATVIIVARRNGGLSQNIGWIGAPGIREIFGFCLALFEPFYFQASSQDPPSMYIVSFPIILLLVAAFTVFFADWKLQDDAGRERFKMMMILGSVPVAIALAASWIMPYSVWGTRHLIIVFAPLAIAASIAVAGITSRAVRAGAVVILAFAVAGGYWIDAVRSRQPFIWCGWEALARGIDRSRPVRVYAFEDVVAYDMWFALRDSAEVFKVNGIKGIEEDKAYFLPRGFDGVRVIDASDIEGDRFYVAYRDIIFNDKHPPLRELREMGYKIGDPAVFESQGQKAILVEVTR